jgi:hypothetical protein
MFQILTKDPTPCFNNLLTSTSHPFIWIHVSGQMRFHDESDKGTASDFVQISEKV